VRGLTICPTCDLIGLNKRFQYRTRPGKTTFVSASMATKSAKIIFITGTDTGAGKTLLTALLLCQLRQSGVRALAMKPFCSGSRADVELLNAVQEEELPRELLNPFYFDDPVAPLVAARQQKQNIKLNEVVRRIRQVQKRCDYLLVEGSGGLLAPLSEGYCISDLIRKLKCQLIVAARNRLGVINHVLMTLALSQPLNHQRNTVVLMGCSRLDESTITNQKILQELAVGTHFFNVPFLGKGASKVSAIKNSRKKMKKTLAQILKTVTLSSRSSGTSGK
jgi:dethiobiotin synthetase